MGLSTTTQAQNVETIRVAPVKLAESRLSSQNVGHSLIAEVVTVQGTHVKIYSGIDHSGMQALAGLLQGG